jgi:hypothetical protein
MILFPSGHYHSKRDVVQLGSQNESHKRYPNLADIGGEQVRNGMRVFKERDIGRIRFGVGYYLLEEIWYGTERQLEWKRIWGDE